MHSKSLRFSTCTLVLLLWGCDRQTPGPTTEHESHPALVEQMGFLADRQLIEASGMQASHARVGDFFVHNDDGRPLLYAINEKGAELGRLEIVPAKNKDWEDLASVPVGDGHWIVAGDIGDNWARRESIKLYFAAEPRTDANDRYSGHLNLQHWLVLNYPDGPRDCEAMAYDPVDNRLLLLSKRDKPPRLYGVDLETALSHEEAVLEYFGTVHPLRPPAPADKRIWSGRWEWISQPTGFDISPDGKEAVVLTYRSLYRFRRKDGEDWLSALQRKPDELIGPPAPQNEAVAYSADGQAIFVTTEKIPAPVFRIEFTD